MVYAMMMVAIAPATNVPFAFDAFDVIVVKHH